MTKFTVRRRVVFACVAVALAVVAAVIAIVGVDVWLHARYARWLGYNVWGYRGKIVGAKQPAEYRVVMLGGSVAYGYSVERTATIPVYLERNLRIMKGTDQFTVVNLAYNAEGAYSFTYTLRDYAYLHYDLAILFEGYNDLTDQPRNTSVFRHQSPIFRLTGYLPIFPLIFREKAGAMMNGGRLNAMYLGSGKTVFRPSWTARAGASALRTAADVEAALEEEFGPMSKRGPEPADIVRETGCVDWALYCQAIAAAVDVARSLGAQVLVATQPHTLGSLRERHIGQQRAMSEMLARRYGNDPNVAYLNLGDGLDMSDETLSGDRIHPTAEGNLRLAAAFTPAVLGMLRTAK